MGSLPKNLCDKQGQQRQSTINRVIRAIAELKAEGYSIKIKDLMERTGLSRSVFAKPHIRELLVSRGITKDTEPVEDIAGVSRSETSRVSSLRDKLRQKEERIAVLTRENESLRDECALLRGRMFLLMQRLDMMTSH